jgi:ACDE family multidrug resistance protein
MDAHQIGLIFFGWGLLLAITSVWVAPMLQRRIGSIPTVLISLSLFALDLFMMAAFTDSLPVLIVGVVAAGAFLGVNNTVITETVMGAAPVERPVASAAYSFVRFSGGAVAPWAASRLGEQFNAHVPFWAGGACVALGVLVLYAGRRFLPEHPEASAPAGSAEQAEAELIGDLA